MKTITLMRNYRGLLTNAVEMAKIIGVAIGAILCAGILVFAALEFMWAAHEAGVPM